MATAPRRAVGVFKEQARTTPASESGLPGYRCRPFGLLPLPPPPLPVPFPLFRPPSPSGLPGELNFPERSGSLGWSRCNRWGAGSRAPGGREGRDAVQCCSFPRQYCTRPGLRPSRPPGPSLTPSGAAPALLALDPDRSIDWSVAAAIVSKWGWENFNHPLTSTSSFTYPSPILPLTLTQHLPHRAPSSAKLPLTSLRPALSLTLLGVLFHWSLPRNIPKISNCTGLENNWNFMVICSYLSWG